MPADRLPAISVVITFHGEGLLAHKSLLSLSRCIAAAQKAGESIEVIATMDRPDDETDRVVRSYNAPGRPDKILALDFGDLGLSRNAAIQASNGRFILICDGDDYLSGDFIVRCLRSIREHGDKTILHPELIVHFGAENSLWWQVGDDDPSFDPACLLACNPWNSCCFASRSTFTETPYQLARPGESGFGFEDWHWNSETLARGNPHRIAKGTVHYVRKKAQGSLNMEHTGHNALIHPTRLFGIGR